MSLSNEMDKGVEQSNSNFLLYCFNKIILIVGFIHLHSVTLGISIFRLRRLKYQFTCLLKSVNKVNLTQKNVLFLLTLVEAV